MNLLEFYPEPGKLIDSELAVLDYLGRSTYINSKQPRFGQMAKQEFARAKAQKRNIQFESYLETDWRGIGSNTSKLRLGIGASISCSGNRFKKVSYALIVSRDAALGETPSFEVLRKFHFDVAIAPGRSSQPLCHLQYCGGALPGMKSPQYDMTQFQTLHPWLSEPRLFFWPVALALVIDMALREFQDQPAKKFIEDPQWRGLVMNQESLLLHRFHQKCVEVINNHSTPRRTLADAFYH